jgi:hypothetical protein
MNRITNALILILFFPTMVLAIFISFDLPLGIFRTTGSQLPYRAELFLGFTLLIAILFSNRSIKRWVGLMTVAKKNRFVFNAPISIERRKTVLAYGVLESTIYMIIGIGLLVLTMESFPAALIFLFFGVEGMVYTIFGAKKFALGLSTKAIIVADREITVIYYNGLRKVSIGQQTLYFDYIQSLQLNFPTDVIPSDQRQAFIANLESVVDPQKVLIHNLGSWKK